MVLSFDDANALLKPRQSKEGQNVQKGVTSQTEVPFKRTGFG